VHSVNKHADASEDHLRISIDAKASVNIGAFSRGGKTRVLTEGCDHDFKTEEKITPFGINVPAYDDLFLYFIQSKVTSDCIVDIIESWWEEVREHFEHINTLVINLDNGGEQQSRRTQFIKRIVEFVNVHKINVKLAYYPPYHSKYNPVERCFGVLEKHWNGSILDSVDTTINFAKTMTWKGKRTIVRLFAGTYETGVKTTKEEMEKLEEKITRLHGLEKWAIDIISEFI